MLPIPSCRAWTCMLAAAAVALLGPGERALASGLAAPMAVLAPAGGDWLAISGGGCGKGRPCPLEPPYAFYPPPRVPLRCFVSRYGAGNCPYAAWGKKDTGACWHDAHGRRICGPAAYRSLYGFRPPPPRRLPLK